MSNLARDLRASAQPAGGIDRDQGLEEECNIYSGNGPNPAKLASFSAFSAGTSTDHQAPAFLQIITLRPSQKVNLHPSTHSPADLSTKTFDVICIGSGWAGRILAARIANAGYSALVVEQELFVAIVRLVLVSS